jgi:hypothetical protein
LGTDVGRAVGWGLAGEKKRDGGGCFFDGEIDVNGWRRMGLVTHVHVNILV